MRNLKKKISAICLLMLFSFVVCIGNAAAARADSIQAAVTAVSFTKSSATIKAGDSVTLTANILPSSSNYLTVVFTSDNSNVTLKRKSNNQIVVTGKSASETTITAEVEATGSSVKLTDTCKVTVTSSDSKSVEIPSKATVYDGSSKVLSTTVVPSTAKVTWKSSNTSVATVNSKGRVYGKGTGTATITATIKGTTIKDTCKVTVKKKEIDIKDTASVYVNSSYSLKNSTTTVPKNTKITWESSDTSIATVNSNGRIYGIKEGEAVITASVSGNVSDTCIVRVKKERISLSDSDIELTSTDSKTITAIVKPSKYTVNWSSSDPNVAVVDGGVITGVNAGSAVIKASIVAKDHSTVSAYCNVTVNEAPTGTVLTLSPKKKTLHVDSEGGTQSAQLTAKVTGTDNTAIVWSIADSDIASITQDGTVTAIKEGTTYVTAALQGDSSVKAKTKIIVSKYDLSDSELAKKFYGTWDGESDGVQGTTRITENYMYLNEDTAKNPIWYYEITSSEKMADKSIWIYARVWQTGGEEKYGLSKISADGKTMQVIYSNDKGQTYTGRTGEFTKVS